MANSRIQRIKMSLPHRPSRQLAVIVFADIVGYTALMQQNEAEALLQLNRFKNRLTEGSASHDGKIIQYYGDGCLLLFSNALEAVRFAIEVQRDFQTNARVPVRIGMHAGDVMLKDGFVFGDTVNLASRIESLGISGSVLLSETVRNQLRNHQDVQMSYLGAFHFKHVTEPMSIYAVTNESFPLPLPEEMAGKLEQVSGSQPGSHQRDTNRKRTRLALIGAGLLMAAGYLFLRPSHDPWMASRWENSIAILPFENLNTDTGRQFIAIGVADEIRNQLATIPSLKVTSRSSSMYFNHKVLPAQQIGESLQATYLLDGTVQETDSVLKISIQLIHAGSDQVEWAPVYEKRIHDVFTIQEEIALEVVDKLELNLSRRERKQLEKSLSLGSITYDMYFRAIDELSTASVESIRTGGSWVSELLRQTRSFPSPSSNLAWLTTLSNAAVWQQGGGRDSLRSSASAYLLEAGKSSVSEKQLHTVQGAMQFYLNWDFDGGEKHAREAIRHGDEKGYALLADILIRTGRFKEARELLLRMMKLDPLNADWWWRYGWIQLNESLVEEAADAFKYALTLDSASTSSCLGLVYTLMHQHQKQEARIRFLDCRQAHEIGLRGEVYEIILLYDTGDHPQAIRRLGVLKKSAEEGQVPEAAFLLACAYTGMQLYDEALAWLRASHERKENAFLDVLAEPLLQPLRSDKRFAAFIAQTEMGQYALK